MIEVGASIFVKVNHHLVDTARELGLKTKPLDDEKVAIWNGSEFVFEESPWKLWSIVKGLRRWGLAPLKVKVTVHAKKDKEVVHLPRVFFCPISLSSLVCPAGERTKREEREIFALWARRKEREAKGKTAPRERKMSLEWGLVFFVHTHTLPRTGTIPSFTI